MSHRCVVWVASLGCLVCSGTVAAELPLPLKPRFRTGRSRERPTIAGQARPGREAQAPWAIDVP